MRREIIQNLQENREEDIRTFVARVTKDYTQQALAVIKEKREQAGKQYLWGEGD